jgi:hypothetical protein
VRLKWALLHLFRRVHVLYDASRYGGDGGTADFLFYSFTGGVNAVMQVDQTNSSARMRFATLGDGVADVDNNIATVCLLQGNTGNTNMSWIRGGTFPTGISVPNNPLFSAFSWSDSGNMRFELNGSWIAPTPFDGNVPYQARLHVYHQVRPRLFVVPWSGWSLV